MADPSGNINTTLWPNDLITCNGTTGNSQYQLAFVVGGVISGTPQCYQVVSTQGNWNLNGPQQPIICSMPAPNPQDATFRNLTVTGFFQAVNGNFSGNLSIGGTLTPTGMISTLPTACTGSNFMQGISVTLQPICSALPSSTGVTSFNARTGAVVPVTNDYSYSQISAAPFLYFNNVAATFRSKWNFSLRFTGTDAAPNTNINLNAPGSGNLVATYAADPAANTGYACFDGLKNIANSNTPCVGTGTTVVDYYWTIAAACTTGVGQPVQCTFTTTLPGNMPDASYQAFCFVNALSSPSDYHVTLATTPLPTVGGGTLSFRVTQTMQNGGGGGTPDVYCHAHHN